MAVWLLKSIDHVAERESIGDAAGAPQHRVHASQQLGEVERLDDVVVGAQPQAAQLVDGLVRAPSGR